MLFETALYLPENEMKTCYPQIAPAKLNDVNESTMAQGKPDNVNDSTTAQAKSDDVHQSTVPHHTLNLTVSMIHRLNLLM